MKICILAAGAAGMFCGSCLRDNALAGALLRAGHKVTLLPLYAPMRVEGGDASENHVFFGGVNAYLQHAARLFRHTPRILDWLLDRPWLLEWAGNIGSDTSPAKLGAFTLDVLRSEEGSLTKELRRLMEYLDAQVRPDVVSIPNLMFVGMARLLRRELKLPVVCELTGEDLFLDGLAEPYRTEAWKIIRRQAGQVNRFVATSEYYAAEMARRMEVERERIKVVHPGLSKEFLAAVAAKGLGVVRPRHTPPVVVYLARMAPEKGLEQLIEGVIRLRGRSEFAEVLLIAGGWMGQSRQKWLEGLKERVAASNLAGGFEYVGELTQEQKVELLSKADVVSVPAIYGEAKGIYVLEAMAAGVPVVQPAHGAFIELVANTGGGVLYGAGDVEALAGGLAGLLGNEAKRQEAGRAGQLAVAQAFTDEVMAGKMVEVYTEARFMSEETAISKAPSAEGLENATAGGDGLVAAGIEKEYPTPAEPLVVLRGVSLRVRPGESLAIIGPSGSGKSTLLNVLGTLDRPTRGTFWLGGVDPATLKEDALASFRARSVGFVFQDHHLFQQCTALENVLIPRLALGRVARADSERAAALLKSVGLSARATHFPSELSGGERQRVAIARAMMNKPSLLLCDEPTGNLDASASRAIGDLLLEAAKGMGAVLVVVTHNLSLALRFGRLARMNDGRLEEDARP